MIGVIRNLLGSRQQQAMDPMLQKMLVTLEAPTDEHKDKLNGWHEFIDDAVNGLKRKSDALEYVKGTGLCKYEIELQKVIAGEMFRRTKRHPDLNEIISLEHNAATNCNHIKQLAYNCMVYEAQLQQTPSTDHLQALREITAELV